MRELRLIAEHKPRYNRRSRFPEKVHFIKLTREPWPRLSLVRRVLDDDADYLGPFSSRKVAERCLAALHEAFPVRQCADRLPAARPRSPCVLAEMGRCLSPCDGSADHRDVRRRRGPAARQPRSTTPPRWSRCCRRTDGRPGRRRALRGGRRAPRPARRLRAGRARAPSGSPRSPAARRSWPPAATTGVAGRSTSIRHGRLAAAGVIPPGADAHQCVADLRAAAETVRPGPGPVPAATAEETEKILRWLESPGVRLVDVDGEWTCPVRRRQAAPGRPRRRRAVPA